MTERLDESGLCEAARGRGSLHRESKADAKFLVAKRQKIRDEQRQEKTRAEAKMSAETADDRKLAQAERLAFNTRKDALFSSFIQTLLAMNGGAIVAVGGMAQALVKQNAWLPYKFYAVSALASFILGMLSTSLSYFARFVQLGRGWTGDSAGHERQAGVVSGFIVFALICFLAGAVAATLGIGTI